MTPDFRNTTATTSSTTWVPAAQAKCEDEIVYAMKMYARRKWYEPRKHLLRQALYWAKKSNEFEDRIKYTDL